MPDPYNLDRFVSAQSQVYPTVTAELSAGRKHGHWMWFIFPQLRGLGHSPMSNFYGLSGLDEARAYLAHPELGARLFACTTLVLDTQAPSLADILGPDDVKFASSMTLFSEADGTDASIFDRALNRWCQGIKDAASLHLLYSNDGPVAGGAIRKQTRVHVSQG